MSVKRNIKGKKILILGGTPQQIKLIEAAKEMGLYTIVTDYIKESEAKRIADKHYMYSITDVENIVKMCQLEDVEAVICAYIDPAQVPYQQICKALNVPCYGTERQFQILTNKREFKKVCIANGIDVIKEYEVEDIEKDKIEYPVLVKPVDSRGSRGQTICYTKVSLYHAIEKAKRETSMEEVLIEKYIEDANEFQVTYFFVNGTPHLIRTVDSYCGTEESNMQRVVACAVSPSRYTKEYLDNMHEKVISMLKVLGIKNGPVFMQGFEKNGKFIFFDPGFRFPGVDYERIYKRVFDVDIMSLMIQFATEGHCDCEEIPEDGVWLKGKRVAILFPTLTGGKIVQFGNFDKIREDDAVISFYNRCNIGDEIEWTYDINQRLCEIDILCDTVEQLKQKIDEIQKELAVYDSEGRNMIYRNFDTERIVLDGGNNNEC